MFVHVSLNPGKGTYMGLKQLHGDGDGELA